MLNTSLRDEITNLLQLRLFHGNASNFYSQVNILYGITSYHVISHLAMFDFETHDS